MIIPVVVLGILVVGCFVLTLRMSARSGRTEKQKPLSDIDVKLQLYGDKPRNLDYIAPAHRREHK